MDTINQIINKPKNTSDKTTCYPTKKSYFLFNAYKKVQNNYKIFTIHTNIMYMIYGKWKVGKSLASLLLFLHQDFEIIEDKDFDIDNLDLQISQNKLLQNTNQIIVSPGIPPHHHIYTHFPHKIISELNFIWQLLRKKNIRNQFTMIGISGTNGKSTTTHIIFELLQKLLPKQNINLTWNFWTPLSETLLQILQSHTENQKHTFVIECSSFMLYNLQNFWFDYSILTNIQTDHLDRHPDFDDYKTTKLNIIQHTKTQAFVHKQIFELLNPTQQKYSTMFNYEYDLSSTKFIGHHNKANLQSVFLLAKQLTNQTKEKINSVISQIQPLPHRLQLIKTINWAKIYDDGICTSAHAQANALQDFDHKIILIAWWAEKWDSFQKSAELFQKKVKYWFLMGKTAPKFAKIFDQQKIPYQIFQDFRQLLTSAIIKTQELKTDLLFSPGCASFGMFKNVYDRIEQFTKLINKY